MLSAPPRAVSPSTRWSQSLAAVQGTAPRGFQKARSQRRGFAVSPSLRCKPIQALVHNSSRHSTKRINNNTPPTTWIRCQPTCAVSPSLHWSTICHSIPRQNTKRILNPPTRRECAVSPPMHCQSIPAQLQNLSQQSKAEHQEHLKTNAPTHADTL